MLAKVSFVRIVIACGVGSISNIVSDAIVKLIQDQRQIIIDGHYAD